MALAVPAGITKNLGLTEGIDVPAQVRLTVTSSLLALLSTLGESCYLREIVFASPQELFVDLLLHQAVICRNQVIVVDTIISVVDDRVIVLIGNGKADGLQSLNLQRTAGRPLGDQVL